MTGFCISSGMAASCNIHCKVTDPSGKVLYDKSMSGTGSSGMLGVMLIGNLAHEPALRKTSEEAITNALLFHINQMEKDIDFSAVQRR